MTYISLLIAMLASVQLYLGIIGMDTEELSTGEAHLKECEAIIKTPDTPETVMIALNMYNQFGILWSLSDPQKALIYLQQAEKLYENYKKQTTKQPPKDITDLFNDSTPQNPQLNWKNFEKLHTLTFYYLAQIYGGLKDALKSSLYCHITLQRQLESQDFDSIEWALNAATLSQFFLEKNGFKQARHHLAASQFILDQFEKELDSQDMTEMQQSQIETFKHRLADVKRCWAKYGLLLLSKSKDRLLNQTDYTDNLSSDLNKLSLDETFSNQALQNLSFNTLDLANYENQITCKFILTIQDARLVFLHIQTCLNQAKTYYTLDSHASDYIEIIQDESQMYLNLLFFEENLDNQAKLHKRRIDLLETVINQINPQYYLPYCRQIWHELGQTYSDILNIKKDKLRETDQRPTPHVLAKINHLIEMSIKHFRFFIDSFLEGNDKQLPDRIGEDYEQVFLRACFHVAALNSKFITLDKRVQLENVKESLKGYKLVYDYCERNKTQEAIPMEFGICKEMVALLPVKIAKLTEEI